MPKWGTTLGNFLCRSSIRVIPHHRFVQQLMRSHFNKSGEVYLLLFLQDSEFENRKEKCKGAILGVKVR